MQAIDEMIAMTVNASTRLMSELHTYCDQKLKYLAFGLLWKYKDTWKTKFGTTHGKKIGGREKWQRTGPAQATSKSLANPLALGHWSPSTATDPFTPCIPMWVGSIQSLL